MAQYDSKQLLEAASDFAHHPGFRNDAVTKYFLDRFPLPLLLSALQDEDDVPGLHEYALVACLERVFRTQHGASPIPQYMPFVQVGLPTDQTPQSVLLACSCLRRIKRASHNEEVSAAAMDAIRGLICSPKGMALVFPADSSNAIDLRSLATRCSSLVASVIYNSNLLGLLESEVMDRSDILVSLSVLELLYELAETQHGTEYLSKTDVLELLCSLISDTSTETISRSRAMLISGRLHSNENISKFVNDSGIKDVIRVIENRLVSLESQANDEYESALEALGQTGSSMKGAELLLLNGQSASRHVTNAAFDRQAHGRQLVLLDGNAEESLRRLMYENASGQFLAVLQQDSEVRIAVCRMLTPLVARLWCLMAICTKQEIINLVTDPHKEKIKLSMDAKYGFCKAIHKILRSISLDPALTSAGAKIEEVVERGPYLARKYKPEAQPVVMTAERF